MSATSWSAIFARSSGVSISVKSAGGQSCFSIWCQPVLLARLRVGFAQVEPRVEVAKLSATGSMLSQ